MEQRLGKKQQNSIAETAEKKHTRRNWKDSSCKWLITALGLSMLAAILYTSLYGIFRREAEANVDNPLESLSTMSYLYQNSYVLYRDLYNRQNQTNISYHELYLTSSEHFKELMDAQFFEEAMKGNYDDQLPDDVTEEEMEQAMEAARYLDEHLAEVEDSFGQMNSVFDYLIEDVNTGAYYSNLPSKDINSIDQYFYVQFLFDEYGNVTVGSTILGNDETRIRKIANEIVRICDLNNLIEKNRGYEAVEKVRAQMPVNCRVTFCISREAWQKFNDEDTYSNIEVYYNNGGTINLAYSQSMSWYEAYNNTSCGEVYALMVLAVMLVAFFLPVRLVEEPWKERKMLFPWVELLVLIGILTISLGSAVVSMVSWVCNGEIISSLRRYLSEAAFLPVYLINIIFLTLFFLCAAYTGICARAVRELGIKEYLKQRLFFYQIFPYLKKKAMELYEELSHFDVTKKANHLILKIVIVNAVVLFIIGSLWVGGFTIAVIYSVLLYFLLRKYISDLQKKYSILLRATNEIAQGNLNVTINEDLGVFEPFKPQVIRIQEGFKNAVEEEVKSQRMKSELITNVSHDLKTPLTAIITYINLLKEENITEEQRKEYLNTLERKSLRLKVLIEDLFEVSKANSNNITLNIMDVDIINLVKQVELEMSDKLSEAGLEVRMNLPEEKYILPLDSQKTYRIYENLFGNIVKYALPGTRVYVTANVLENGIEITLKNITAQELHVTPEELTERFVRGDASRNTEGSGLGLAIAKSFTELQGGAFEIRLDGDLFKAVTVWKKPE